MANKPTITWENFVKIHQSQLLSIGLPEKLWKCLYSKLAPNEVRDAGTVFELRQQDQTWKLLAKSRIAKHQDVFLIDHAWTSDGDSKARKMLYKKPELVIRMQKMMCLDSEQEDNIKMISQEEVVQQISGVDSETAQGCLDKTKNDIIQATILAEGGDKQKPDLNLDDLDEKKVLTFEEFKSGFEASVDEEDMKSLSEEFLHKMYEKYLKDNEDTKTDVRYGEATTAKYSWSETDEGDGSITVMVSVPSETTKSSIESNISIRHWKLGVKGKHTIIDGDFYSKIQPDECFWTFDGPGVLQITLQKVDPSEGLWPYLIKDEVHLNAQQIHDEAIEKSHKKRKNIDSILEAMWKYNQTYQAVMVKGGPQEHLWYVMDEVGSGLMHSSTPNMNCSPFAFAVNGFIYSVMWPIADIEKDDVCTRDFCPPLIDGEMPLQKEARLLACLPELPDEYPKSFLQEYALSVSSSSAASNIQAKIEALNPEEHKTPLPGLSLRCYINSKNDMIKSILASLNCSFTDKPEDAEAIWVDEPLPNVDSTKMVNFLSGDDFLTRRDALPRLLTKKLGQIPWYPKSFNLRSQLPAFCVEHYMKGVSTMWMLRSANPRVFHFNPVMSSDLRRIIRLGETGPLVASEFHITGTLTHKKHFVLQFTVMVQSLKPLELLIHNTPNIRKTPQPFDTMAPIDEYNSGVFITTKDDIVKQDEDTFKDFVQNFEKHYTPRCKQTWAQVQKTMFTRILELFAAVSTNLTIPGKSNSNQGQDKLSAVYGVDVILMEDMSALIIGVDAVPVFANDQVAKEVLFLMYGNKKDYCKAGGHVTRVSIE